MRAHTNISTKERRSFTLSDFRGVDFSSSPLSVQANRATNMKNFINEFGVNRKRHGWKQVLQMNGAINGIYHYQNGEMTELLVYAGNTFYRVQDPEEKGDAGCIVTSVYTDEAIESCRVEFYYQNRFVYIVGAGVFLRYSTEMHTMELVGDFYDENGRLITNAYIPTTTISIDTNNVADTARKTLDQVNLLTGFRKNTLVGSEISSESSGAQSDKTSWILDGVPSKKYGVDVVIETIGANGIIKTEALYTRTEGIFDGSGTLVRKGGDGTVFGRYHTLSGKTYLYLHDIDTVHPDGIANIEVTFYVEPSEEWSGCVAGCRFGTLFGVGGAADRLFLSGNSAHPNVEYFSEADDFTYFPDQYTAVMGTDRNAITGFLRLSDNALAIFKETNDFESAVYYQTGEYRSDYTDTGELEKILPVFSITAGATGESALSPYAMANLAGDNIILSKNGVFAIELYENIATNTRIARERSRAINARLCAHERLEDAVGIVYRGKYYLAIDGICYVADSRYRYQPADSTSYNYEWWFWDHIPARVWATVDDALWFGSENGMICKFDDAYTDRTFIRGGETDITFNFAENLVKHAPDVTVEENDRFIVKTGGLFAVYLDEFTIKGDRIYVPDNQITKVFDGAEVYLDGVGYSGLSEGVVYYIDDTDFADGSFCISDANGVPQVLDDVDYYDFRLLSYLSGRELYVSVVDEMSFRVKTAPEDLQPLTLTDYFMTVDGDDEVLMVPINPIIELWNDRNVVAEWYTPIFDMNTNECAKTLLKLTVSADPKSGGRLEFGFETRRTSRTLLSKGMQAFSFDDLDFSNFSFETGFTSSYSVKVRERNFNYIQFRFISDSDTDCAVNSMTAIYKINKRNLGVR